jgi:predicted O-methyltransferase YrrM
MILDDPTKEYLLTITPERDAVLSEMEEIARERNFPIIGPLVGRILHQLTRLKGAKRIFEMGSGFGYSAIWFATALPDDGILYYSDSSSENFGMAEEFFRRSGLEQKIRMESGDAIEILRKHNGTFDIILNDIDKESYPASLPVALDKLEKGGILITDNILWKGKVTAGDTDASTTAIREYTSSLYNNPTLYTTVIPVRDGISISLKLS